MYSEEALQWRHLFIHCSDGLSMKSGDTYRTILIIVVGFVVVYLITGWQWSILVALIIGGLSALSLKIAQFIELLWMKLSEVLGLIVPNILLSLIFYLMLTPIAFISRIFNKDALRLKKSEVSLWNQRPDGRIEKKSFERPW